MAERGVLMRQLANIVERESDCGPIHAREVAEEIIDLLDCAALERAVSFGENANLLLQETLRRLGPAAPPQPITDAQKTGERFLVWYTYAANTGEWFVASWDTINGEGWCVGNPNPHFCALLLPDKDVTRYLPLPPDAKP